MKFTLVEKDVIDRITILTNKSYGDVKEIFQALFISLAIDMGKNSNEMNIPYVGKVKIDYQKIPIKNKFDVQMSFEITPNVQLTETIKQIALEENTDCVIEMIKKEIGESISDQIGLEYAVKETEELITV